MKQFFVGFLALLPFLASQAAADSSSVFVPRAAGKGLVPIEIVMPEAAQKDARAKAYELRRLVERTLRPERHGDMTTYLGKCIVEPRQLEVGSAMLLVQCFSVAMWQGDDPYMAIGAPDTPEEVMVIIEAFLVKHRERLTRPRPGRGGMFFT